MGRRGIVIKVGVAVVLGLLQGWYVGHDSARMHAEGLDAFLIRETHRYELMSASPAFQAIAGFLFQLAILGAYEGLAALIQSLTTSTRSASDGEA